jgi:hypothetical protein
MDYFLKHTEFFSNPVRSDFSKVSKEDVLQRFFADYSLPELRHLLWVWFEVAITTENDAYSSASERANLLLLYQRLEELLEAVMMLSEFYEDDPGE